jgi:catecholate siderophore receptor
VGAQITATPERRTSSLSTVSDQTGKFSLELEPGKYIIRITAMGFLEASEAIEISNLSQTRDFLLRLPVVRQTIEVKQPIGYQVPAISSATKTLTPLRDVPQSITVVSQELMRDQGMTSVGDVVRYVPGITVHQGENNRDDLVIRGNRSSADFFLNGVRDDVQYYRDLYNLERVEALKGPNAMIFGRGGGGGVLNRVTKEALFMPIHGFTLQGGRFGNKRATADFNQPLNSKVAFRLNGLYEKSDSFRTGVGLERDGVNPTLTFAASDRTKVTAGYEYLRDRRVADRGITSFQGRAVPIDPTTFYGNPNDSHVRAGVHLASTLVEHRFDRVTVANRTMFGDYDRFYQNYVPGATTADQRFVALTAYNNATHRKNVFNQTDIITSVSTGSLRHTVLVGAEFGGNSPTIFETPDSSTTPLRRSMFHPGVQPSTRR